MNPSDDNKSAQPSDSTVTEKAIANAQKSEADYMANTFSQFGLNINNLLMGNGNAEENKTADGGDT